MKASLPTSYFDALYAQNPDPWNFGTSAYEAAKYQRTLAALQRPHYACALDIGCSIGIFTSMLAPRCDRLVALEPAAAALAQAKQRCAGKTHIAFAQMRVPDEWPDGLFELIILSEVLYYLDRPSLAHLARRVETALAPRGELVLVHYTKETDYPLTGDEAASAFIAAVAGFAGLTHHHDEPSYRLDCLQRM